MRPEFEQSLALECLKLALGDLAEAESYFAFVTGRKTDDAKARLDAVREALKTDL